MPVLETSTPNVEFDASAAVDLFWMLIGAGRAAQPGTREPDAHLAPLTADAPLVRRVATFWNEGPDDFSELLVLADHAGVLTGLLGGEAVVAAACKASVSVPLEPLLRSETPEARETIRRRLGVLRSDRKVRRQYERLLLDVWSVAASDWSQRAVPIEQDIVTRCRERSRREATWTDLVDDASRLEGFLGDARTRAGESRLLVCISAYGGALLLDLPSAQLIGLRGKDLVDSARREVTLRLATRLRALSDPTRLSLLLLLVGEELGVGELAVRLGVAQPTVSNHLKALKEAGLVETRRANGRQRLAIDRRAVEQLLEETRRHLGVPAPRS